MSKPVRLDADAEREAAEAFAWYEEREPGLGERFLLHLTTALESIEDSPGACAPVPGTFPVPVRAARVKKFPYRVVFMELPDRYRVVAIVHQSQEPGYWKDRLSG